MNWRHMLFLSGFTVFLLLIVLDGRRSVVKATMGGSSEEIPDLKKKLFVQRWDASNFLKKHKKRYASSSEESDERNGSEKLDPEYDNVEDEREERNESTERPGRMYEYFYEYF